MDGKYNPKSVLRNLEPNVRCVDLDDYLRSVNSPLLGLGNFIKDCSECFKINELFIFALIALESGWGRSSIAKTKNNLCGWGAINADPMEGAWRFHCQEGCIMTVCHHLDQKWLTKGGEHYKDGTIGGVGRAFTTDPDWANKICQIMNQVKGYIDERNK